ncbi:unnamed protein product [Fraxinus pennsylvanica]|uniref:Uncharacterized protein n=1 Tax=Fraxinus pennsylvanica TaxID=56036 RepID=A0AAD2DME0_9LAMI|nr:unnamed protein product [Fraxinus pennsylvanica]
MPKGYVGGMSEPEWTFRLERMLQATADGTRVTKLGGKCENVAFWETYVGARVRGPTDRLRLSFGDEDSCVNVNKPDFRELDLGSPVSTLRTRQAGLTATATSSSSSSSGSVSRKTSGGPSPTLSKRPIPKKNHSGELLGCSVESSLSTVRHFKPGHTQSYSGGTLPLIHSGGGGSVNSPSVNVLPTRNICPSGRILAWGAGPLKSMFWV